MRRILALFIICALALLLPTRNIKAEPDIPDGYRKIAESSELLLYYNDKPPSIIVEDKRNHFMWSSAFTDEGNEMKDTSDLWLTSFRALFNLSYTNVKEDTDQIMLTNSVMEEANITTKDLEKGISIIYNFSKLGITVQLDISLDGDSLAVRVPIESIEENKNFGVVSIEILPFFGAATDREDGYAFYPDGSGALTYFKSDHPEYTENYRGYVYGLDTVDLDAYKAMESDGREQAMMPVFGMKRGGNAFIGVINEGEYDSIINFSPSGYRININRISAEFVYRRLYRATRANTVLVDRVEKGMLHLDHAVRYTFLAGRNADYSGMANAYRQYLLGKGNIKKVIENGDKIPLGLDLLTGIKEDRLLFDKFIPMTTFDQAKQIIEEFYNRGVNDIQVNLMGWTKEGFKTYPVHLPPNNALGGWNGLKRLADYTSKNSIVLFLQDNFVDALSENGGFSIQNDVARQRNGLVVTNAFNNAFLFNPVKTWELFINNFLPNLNGYGINGLNFEKLGLMIYFDYHREYPLTRGQTADYWNKFISESSKQFGSAAVHGGNAYILKQTDRIFDIPANDSGYFFSDTAVPFYQMVVHGLIPYSSSPGNLFYDPQRQKLKWIEYGYMPYYQLTYQDSKLLKYTDYNQLFTSYYGDWIETAASAYKEFNDKLGTTWSMFITDHEKITEDIYKTTYQNGTAVYVNYGGQSAQADGHTIEALSYIVVDERGNVK
ncbi:DUF5696 domain-containing protein [Mahella australiensis]|uniref:Uncharacterized protein n=1 Tax=Mahella australiensis (strain DSM 15567 / CIP 107919 / 50-1 BON) TaxID=697281 RepID=F3ZV98_MAHA5|nr:DUF5696 domain-containing protein [Mahella australiensis]AEE95248.1 hypothetical protein Mahau_0025 [Mahella australiensis 50-1 BON]